jgi:hypothetical protein
MSFPLSPANNQVTLENGISYTYNASRNFWYRTPATALASITSNTFTVLNSIIFSDGTTQTSAASPNDSYARTTANTATNNITVIQGVDVGQNTRMTVIEGVDVTQNTNITIANNAAQAAFAQANATAGGLTTANSRITVAEGVDTTQNTNITIATNAATAAFAQANATAGGLTTANSRITVAEGVDTTQNTNITNATNAATAAFTKANTAITTSGGSITGSLNVSQDLAVTGNLTVLGATTSINTTSFVVSDSLIVMGTGNYTSDLLDIGLTAHYNDGTNAHAGIVRDATTKEWYVFKGYTPEHSANNNIDINHASFAKANVNANYFKGNVIFPDGTVQATAVNLRMTGSSTPPSTPTVGDLWYDTDIDVLLRYTYDGSSNNWVDITGPTIGRSSYIRPTYLISANVA